MENPKNNKLNLINEILGTLLGSILIILSLIGFQLFWNTSPYLDSINKHMPENWNPQLLLTMFTACILISIILIILGIINYKSSRQKGTKCPGLYFILGGLLGLFPFLGFLGGFLAWLGSEKSAKN
ncbi:hypothetical protein [Lactococcus petauri]|uniref:hypothetical protein n=1 Tax=Lactococcus petauri TaxID=1940789 RepID=UPI001F05A751|nr:hypothetical protein [Lactococcus petauri]MCH1712937.1 hypothetical protein [Lactococcus petauri]